MKTPDILVTSLLATFMLVGAASAQEPPAPSAVDGEFSVQRFEPVPGPRNFLSVAGARTAGDLTWSTSLFFDYQRQPFTIKSCLSPTDCSAPNATNSQDVDVIENMFTWNVMGSFTPVEWVQIGLRVPVMYATGDGIDVTTGGPAAEGLEAVGLGDVYLEGKFRVYGDPTDVFVLGAAADISAPTGHATADGQYLGNSSPVTGGVRLIGDIHYEDFFAAVNARMVFKENATFGNTTLGPELRYGAALAYRFHPLFRGLVEGFGSTAFSTTNGANAFEVDGGVQITPLDGMVVLTLAGGAGVVQGVGVPLARGIFGFAFNYDAVGDADGDGIPDGDDQCPNEREDLDGIQDEDGCPEIDADRDNIPDDVDRCPLQPETENGYKDDDGCPDSIEDSDGDGIPDGEDKCPTLAGKMTRPDVRGCPDADGDGVPDDGRDKCLDGPLAIEDADGFQDFDGCLDEDNDGDGVPDVADECGDFAETMNGYQDGDGCPDVGPDADGDGIADAADRCANAPENYNDNQDDDGCVDPGGSLVIVKRDEVRLVNAADFAGDAPSARTEKALNALANALKNWVSIMRLEIQVTAGDAKVAEARAKAVKAYLVKRGIEERRLVAKGAAGKDDVSFTILDGPR
jgi:OmpA-OmpF porin, OOP family